MKRCPTCRRDYHDDSLLYCLDDGAGLLEGPANANEASTAIFHADELPSETPSNSQIPLPAPTPNSTNRFKWFLAAGVTVVVGLSGLLGYRSLTAPSQQISSIAVMPFVNEGGNSETEYLSDGMTESLISSLSQVPNLKVKPRSTVFRYKGKETDAREIGKELNVQAILNGRITRRGQDVTLYIELINAALDETIWSETYDRKQSDLVALQSDIAGDVSKKLKSKLSGTDIAKIEKKYTPNDEAYQLYLRGQYEWHKHTLSNVRKAIDYYQQALERDPNYALAYFGISASYGVMGNNYVSPRDAFPKAKAYAAKALEIDPSLSEAHTGMGAVEVYYEWDWPEAERELKLAQTLDASDVEAHNVYGDYLDAMGRLDESRVERSRSQELDPLSPMYSTTLGSTLYLSRRYDEAIAQFSRTIALEPNFDEAYLYLGQAYSQKKMYAEAIETLQKGLAQSGRQPSLVAALGETYALAGEHEKAKMAIAELQQMSGEQYISPYYFAVIYVGMGDRDETFAWLEKAYQDRAAGLIWLSVEPAFDPIRSDARFGGLLKRLNLQARDVQ